MRKRFFIFAILVMICSITIGQTKYSQELVNSRPLKMYLFTGIQ